MSRHGPMPVPAGGHPTPQLRRGLSAGCLIPARVTRADFVQGSRARPAVRVSRPAVRVSRPAVRVSRPRDPAGSRDGGPHTGLTRDLARIEVESLVSDLRLTPTWFTRPAPAPGGGGRRLAGPGLRRLGVGAGEPHEEGSDPPGERGRSVGARTANVGDGHAKQLGIGDRSGGTRGEARCDVGQRISSLGRAARWPTTGVREPQRSRLPPWTAWPGWVMRVLRPGDAGLHSARRPRAGYPWPR